VPDLRQLLQQRIAEVEGRIQAACTRSRRARGEVTLVAVTKTISPEVAALLPELGIVELGESRPQELWRKAATLPASVHWHLDQWCDQHEHPLSVLLEVNASGEANKSGMTRDELTRISEAVGEFRRVRIRGLMTMAAYEEDPERCRPTFALLRRLRDELRPKFASPHELMDLSMGMTNDFEVAIEEGATIVRIGSALFEGLPSA
jgi:PLP dependent protein